MERLIFLKSQERRCKVFRSVRGQKLLCKEGNPFERDGLTNRKFAKRLARINKYLKKAKPTSFTFSTFLHYETPNQYFFTFDPSLKKRSVKEWYQHCTNINSSKDICVEPLRFLAKESRRNFPKKNFHWFLKKTKLLVEIEPKHLSCLTLDQRKYLAKIHSNTSINTTLKKILEKSKEEVFIHGDYRMANLLFRKDEPPLHVADWELFEKGPKVYDWSMLMADYILLYLCHYIESSGNPQKILWSHVETLLKQHYSDLRALYPKGNNLSNIYCQWIGIHLLLQGCFLLHEAPSGEKLSQLLFQIGRRFLLESGQLSQKYFK